ALALFKRDVCPQRDSDATIRFVNASPSRASTRLSTAPVITAQALLAMIKAAGYEGDEFEQCQGSCGECSPDCASSSMSSSSSERSPSSSTGSAPVCSQSAGVSKLTRPM